MSADHAADVPAGAATSGFSVDTYKRLVELEDQLLLLAWRQGHIVSTHAELVRVAREKPFFIYHEPLWRMLLSERDMIIVDLASWAKGFYSKGGFLHHLEDQDLQALSLHWQPEPNEDERDALAYNRKWRKAAFDRLFPDAANETPNADDIRALVRAVRKRFEPLLVDRHRHRAHKFEHEKQATAAMLVPAEVTKYLTACQRVVADLRCLSSNSSFDSHGYDAKPKPDDDHAQDMIDLVLVGTINWIVEWGVVASASSQHRFYWQKRNAYYERLHAAHEAAGVPDHPFNDRSRPIETALVQKGEGRT
jgi:hypothetical protein